MQNGTELVSQLRNSDLPPARREELVRNFARATGWRPSYEIDYPTTRGIACGHLLVEHGLKPVVAITFLRRAESFEDLKRSDRHLLLSISYNNLVDWHYFPDKGGLWITNNRSTRPADAQYVSLAENPDAWMAAEFDKLIGRRPGPNLPALDDALIDTVSHWKRLLSAELGTVDLTVPISELFNAIFFVRALEDHLRNTHPNTQRALLVEQDTLSTRSIRAVLSNTVHSLNGTHGVLPTDLWDQQALAVFDGLASDVVFDLLSDFYDNRFAPYQYDFSLISKYALSHIYEHYISNLKVEVAPQRTLFPDAPLEVANREIGGYYTPDYIARFFARFLKNEHTASRFRVLRVADPACGSGIFLRTILEMQCDPLNISPAKRQRR